MGVRPLSDQPASAVTPEHRPRWFRRHPRLALSLFALIGILVMDFAVGSVLGAIGVTLPAMTPNTVYRERHPVYHHGMRPNTAHDGKWGDTDYAVHINNLGLKDAEVRELPLRSKTRKRVLLMGDSFTEGIGIEHPHTFAGLLDQRMRDHGLEFMNAGVSSYSPAVYLRKTQYLIDTVGLQVDHVFVGIDMSDIFDEIAYSFDDERNVRHKHDTSRSKALKRFLAEHTVLIGALRVGLRALRNAGETEAESRLNKHRCLWANEASLWKDYGERGLKLATRHMSELHEYLTAKGIRLSIMIYPWPDQIVRRDVDCKQVEAWTAWAGKRKVDVVNLFPVFIGKAEPNDVLGRYFLRGDVHWNKAGHSLVADRVEEWFRRR